MNYQLDIHDILLISFIWIIRKKNSDRFLLERSLKSCIRPCSHYVSNYISVDIYIIHII